VLDNWLLISGLLCSCLLAKGYSSVPTVTWTENFHGGQFSEILLKKNNSALAKLF
jgi:hypothetical protein